MSLGLRARTLKLERNSYSRQTGCSSRSATNQTPRSSKDKLISTPKATSSLTKKPRRTCQEYLRQETLGISGIDRRSQPQLMAAKQRWTLTGSSANITRTEYQTLEMS